MANKKNHGRGEKFSWACKFKWEESQESLPSLEGKAFKLLFYHFQICQNPLSWSVMPLMLV
ncbi:hypothetical protein CR513_23994, partial [Mucuna pruriens]